MTTTGTGAQKELAENDRPGEIPVIVAMKKYIYELPSGRKLKVIVADEREMAAELATLRLYRIA